jgi:site-specific recombinase XerD
MEKLVRDGDNDREVREPLVGAASLDCVPNRVALTEEDIWLAGQRSARTRKSYKTDIEHFMRSLGITSHDELVKADRAMVIAWRRLMEHEGVRPRTIMRRMASLSSLFNHFIEQGLLTHNPVRTVKRPTVAQNRGVTPAFSSQEAAQLLELPNDQTVQGLRDRALLSVLLQAGLRRSEVAGLRVKDFYREEGFDALRFMKKGNLDHKIALHPQTAARIRDYLQAAGHGDDFEGALFRPVKSGHWRNSDERRGISPDAINRIVKKYAAMIGIERGYSAHSCRSTFITHALKSGAKLEHVQQTVGHAHPSTTQSYDRSNFDPEKSATFFANFK